MDKTSSFEDSSPSSLPDGLAGDHGLPADRLARIAARRAFVEMKQLFMRAVADLNDSKGRWLRHQVRHARQPGDLWQLRGALIASLRAADQDTRHLRGELYHGLDTVFPDIMGAGSSGGWALSGWGPVGGDAQAQHVS